jgi:hypothetical protein
METFLAASGTPTDFRSSSILGGGAMGFAGGVGGRVARFGFGSFTGDLMLTGGGGRTLVC